MLTYHVNEFFYDAATGRRCVDNNRKNSLHRVSVIGPSMMRKRTKEILNWRRSLRSSRTKPLPIDLITFFRAKKSFTFFSRNKS